MLVDRWELNMAFLENLTNDAFANKMADYYHTHIGVAEFKNLRAESTNERTPMWLPQPFIQRGIQGENLINFEKINIFTAPVHDTERVAKFMGSPKGLIFIAKQVGLQLSNPKGEFLAPGPINAGRIYNPLATVAQIPAGALGIHIDRHALGPLNPEALNYEKRIKAKTLIKSNRLVDIATDLKVGYFRDLKTTPKGGLTDTSGMTRLQASVALLKESNFYLGTTKKIGAMSGLGGPGSLFGIGRTVHRTSTTTGLDGLYQIHYKDGSSYKDMKSEGGNYVGTIGPLGKDKDYFFNIPERPNGDAVKENFYKPPKDTIEPGNPGDDSYTKLFPEGRYIPSASDDAFNPITTPSENEQNALLTYKTLDYGGITRAGKEIGISSNIKSFSKESKYDPVSESMAAYGIINYGKSAGVSDDYGYHFENDKLSFAEDDQKGMKDFIKFEIADSKERVKFRAYGLGSITDNTSFSWSEVKYAGRSMAQHKFDSVSRDISHDLMIVSFTPLEMTRNMEKLNKLYQLASPSINSVGYSTGAHLKLTLGDIHNNTHVIIDKITFTVDDSTSWDIGVGDDTSGLEIPTVIRLSLSYKLITNAGDGLFTNESNYFSAKSLRATGELEAARTGSTDD